jgi:hypothetical protein
VKLPFDASVTAPLTAFATSVAVSVAPASISVSLPSTLPLTGVSSVVDAVSLTAIGASFTPVTVIVTEPTFEMAVPSVAV